MNRKNNYKKFYFPLFIENKILLKIPHIIRMLVNMHILPYNYTIHTLSYLDGDQFGAERVGAAIAVLVLHPDAEGWVQLSPWARHHQCVLTLPLEVELAPVKCLVQGVPRQGTEARAFWVSGTVPVATRLAYTNKEHMRSFHQRDSLYNHKLI